MSAWKGLNLKDFLWMQNTNGLNIYLLHFHNSINLNTAETPCCISDYNVMVFRATLLPATRETPEVRENHAHKYPRVLKTRGAVCCMTQDIFKAFRKSAAAVLGIRRRARTVKIICPSNYISATQTSVCVIITYKHPKYINFICSGIKFTYKIGFSK